MCRSLYKVELLLTLLSPVLSSLKVHRSDSLRSGDGTRLSDPTGEGRGPSLITCSTMITTPRPVEGTPPCRQLGRPGTFEKKSALEVDHRIPEGLRPRDLDRSDPVF